MLWELGESKNFERSGAHHLYSTLINISQNYDTIPGPA